MKMHTWLKIKLATVLFVLVACMNAHAVETAAPDEPEWGFDPVEGALLRPGIAVHTVGTLITPKVSTDGDHALKLYDVRSPIISADRPVQDVDVHTHHNWDTGSIGNVYGLAIDRNRNIYTTASTHFGAFFGFTGANQAKITFGSIGAGVAPDTVATDDNPGDLNDLAAAGTIYKIDAITGDVSIFAQLPQQASLFSHLACESEDTVARSTGPALGNIAYDPIHNQFFVSNFEDGKIYRIDTDGNQLSVFDPGLEDDGSVGFAGSAADPAPYGLAVNPDGSMLYFGTHAINQSPELFAINLDASGNFSGSEIDQNAKLGDDLQYTQDIGGNFVGGSVWVSFSDLKFTPDGELIVGLRTGCNGSFATSHNHGGS